MSENQHQDEDSGDQHTCPSRIAIYERGSGYCTLRCEGTVDHGVPHRGRWVRGTGITWLTWDECDVT